MQIIWKFTGDGLLAFAGGTLALIGVWLRNRQSVNNLQKQFEEEKEARDEEARSRCRSLANALIVEIMDYKIYHIDAFISRSSGGLVKFHGEASFPVYHANSGKIGELDEQTVRSVVHFYNLATEQLGAEARYRALVSEPCLPQESYEEKQERETSFFGEQVVRNLNTVKAAAEDAIGNLQKTFYHPRKNAQTY